MFYIIILDVYIEHVLVGFEASISILIVRWDIIGGHLKFCIHVH
jgi:hypothetical protein